MFAWQLFLRQSLSDVLRCPTFRKGNFTLRAVLLLYIYIYDFEVENKTRIILFVVPVYSYRRAYSLDVEVSACGFTKDMERDGALLHPAGPDEEEDDDDNDDNEDSTDEEAEREERSQSSEGL